MNAQLATQWQPAKTAVLVTIHAQLAHCQQAATTGIFCDFSGIGKSFAGRQYAAQYKNVGFVDCSRAKTKHQFIRALAKAFGVDSRGRLIDIADHLIAHLQELDRPLIILDEAGDLDYPAFLEIKALYNATENECGWYMMGAEGLEEKMERLRDRKKVGYAEIHDRFGARYQCVLSGMPAAEQSLARRAMAAQVLKANLPGMATKDADKLLTDTACNLRRLYKEIVKINPALAA